MSNKNLEQLNRNIIDYLRVHGDKKTVSMLANDKLTHGTQVWSAFAKDSDFERFIFRLMSDRKDTIDLRGYLLGRYNGYENPINDTAGGDNPIYPLHVLIALNGLDNFLANDTTRQALLTMKEHGISFSYDDILIKDCIDFIQSIPEIGRIKPDEIIRNIVLHQNKFFGFVQELPISDLVKLEGENKDNVNLEPWNKLWEVKNFRSRYEAIKNFEKGLVAFSPSSFNQGIGLIESPEIKLLPRFSAAQMPKTDRVIDAYGHNPLASIEDTHILQASLRKKLNAFMARQLFDNAAQIQGSHVPSQRRHMIFAGSPGTGKTTIAEHIGIFFNNINVLSSGHVVSVTGTSLIGKFVGHSAPKVEEAIDRAKGGILFIDEAYHLAEDRFGPDVVNELLAQMESNKDDLIVIIAGYQKDIDRLLNTNQGLKSRFANTIIFDDFSQTELRDILNLNLEQRPLFMSEDAKDLFINHLLSMKEEKPNEFGNARTLEVFLNDVINARAERWITQSGRIEDRDLLNIGSQDVKTAIGDIQLLVAKPNAIGFGTRGGQTASQQQLPVATLVRN